MRDGRQTGRYRASGATADIVGNVLVALGVLFLLDRAAGLRMGTPSGALGAVAALAMIAVGLAQVVLPARARRTSRLRGPTARPSAIQAEIEADLALLRQAVDLR